MVRQFTGHLLTVNRLDPLQARGLVFNDYSFLYIYIKNLKLTMSLKERCARLACRCHEMPQVLCVITQRTAVVADY